MEILVIGNGFDLAHNLPTKYSDFIEFIRVIREVIDKGIDKVNWGKLNPHIQVRIQTSRLLEILNNKQYWLDWVGNNIWVEYFNKNQVFVKEGWIDFESEIASVIKSLDADMTEADGKRLPLHSYINQLSNPFLAEYYSEYSFVSQYEGSIDKNISFKEIRDRLFSDLNKLIRTLEFYLIEYVGNIEINVVSPDIMGISPDKLLSFNYTDTYSKLYGKGKQIEYDYIHGKADQNHSVVDNRLVLGIDEYLPEERRNTDIDFIVFKKFYQRIHKETGCLYKDWVEAMQSYVLSVAPDFETDDTYTSHKLYIFGHSLDITDKDIIKELILNDKVDTTIFYYNREIYGQQIANLVKVIGQDELIRRTGGPSKTITFKQQSAFTENRK